MLQFNKGILLLKLVTPQPCCKQVVRRHTCTIIEVQGHKLKPDYKQDVGTDHSCTIAIHDHQNQIDNKILVVHVYRQIVTVCLVFNENQIGNFKMRLQTGNM